MLKAYQFQPGINKNDTLYGSEGFWVDGDKVRFRNGKPQKLGGWTEVSSNPENCSDVFRGSPRTMHAWSDNAGNPYLGIGTSDGVFVYNFDCITDLTLCVSAVPASVFTTQSGTQIFTVSSSDFPTDFVTGSWLDIGASVSAGGQILFGQYEITSTGSNEYELDARVTFTSDETVTTSVNICFFPNSGSDAAAFANTYGAGAYGLGPYGVGASAASTTSRADNSIRFWFLDNWGDTLLVLKRGENLYEWKPSEGLTTDVSIVPRAPTESFNFFITQPRPHVVLLGTSAQTGDYDPMLVRWSSDGDYDAWEASAANTAGEQALQAGSYLIAGLNTRRENLIFSDTALFSMQELASEPYFTFDLIGQQCGLLGPNAAIAVNDIVFWMSYNNFYIYDGVVKPLPCSLNEAIFENKSNIRINLDNREKVVCGTNTEFFEIWWLYPSGNSTENDRYVIYNYVEDTWYDGTIERTSWLDANVFQTPYACDTTPKLYLHEEGKNDSVSSMYSYLQSGAFDIDDGDDKIFIREFMPDFQQEGEVRLSFDTYPFPYTAPTTKGPYAITSAVDHLNLRARGRQMSILLESSVLNGDWELGTIRFDIQPDGKR